MNEERRFLVDGVEVALLPLGADALLLGVENLVVVREERRVIELVLGQRSPRGIEPALRARVAAARAGLSRPPAPPPSREAAAITQLNVANTLRCNMRCSYCYNELATKDRKGSETTGTMSAATARRLIDGLLSQSGSEPGLALVFIGGEPLLDRRGLFRAVDYAQRRCAARGKSLGVSVYTNGVRMDREVIAWANEHQVSLVVSLDGPPEQHDRHRRLRGGGPTAARVLRNIALLMEHSTHPLRRVRGVASEPGALLPLHRYFHDLGFNELYVQAAYDTTGFSGRDAVGDLQALLAWYRSLLLAGKAIGVHPFTSILERLTGHGGELTNWYPCAAGINLLGVGPDGSLHSCHHSLGEKRFRLGHADQGIPGPKARAAWTSAVAEREGCRECWARHLCGGECYHRAFTAGRGWSGIISEACANKRAIILAALDCFTAVAARRPQVLEKVLDHRFARPRPKPRAFALQSLAHDPPAR